MLTPFLVITLIILYFCLIACFQEMLNPVQNASETMESVNKQLRALIGRHKVDANLNINPLSMKLGGIIDAAVMGGVSNYEKVRNVLTLIPQTSVHLLKRKVTSRNFAPNHTQTQS